MFRPGDCFIDITRSYCQRIQESNNPVYALTLPVSGLSFMSIKICYNWTDDAYFHFLRNGMVWSHSRKVLKFSKTALELF